MLYFGFLFSRFSRVKFNKCDKEDAVGYLKFYNQMFKKTRHYVDEEELDFITSEIDENLSITY